MACNCRPLLYDSNFDKNGLFRPGSKVETMVKRYMKPIASVNKGALLNRDEDKNTTWDERALERLDNPTDHLYNADGELINTVAHLSMEWVKPSDVEREGIAYWSDGFDALIEKCREHGVTNLYGFFHYHKGENMRAVANTDRFSDKCWDAKWRYDATKGETWVDGIEDAKNGMKDLYRWFGGSFPIHIVWTVWHKLDYSVEPGSKAMKFMAQAMAADENAIPYLWEHSSNLLDPDKDEIFAKRIRQFCQEFILHSE